MLEGCEVVASTGPMQRVPAPSCAAANGASSASLGSFPTAAASRPMEPEGHPDSSQEGMGSTSHENSDGCKVGLETPLLQCPHTQAQAAPPSASNSSTIQHFGMQFIIIPGVA